MFEPRLPTTSIAQPIAPREVYRPDTKPVPPQPEAPPKVGNTLPSPPPAAISRLGTWVAEVLRVRAGREDLPGGASWPQYTFPHTTMLKVSRAKKIVETEVSDGGGEVVQGIHLGTANVSITGSVVGHGNLQPFDELAALNRILNLRAPLEVESPYLNALGIFQIYIKSHDFPREVGRQNVIGFSAEARSWEPMELELVPVNEGNALSSGAETLDETPLL